MTKKNALMYCCCSEKHTGHLIRAMELARELSESMEVTVLLDDETPDSIDIPESVRLVYLPQLSVDPDSNVFDFDTSQKFKISIIARRDKVLEEFERLKPRLVVVDNFPFTQHRLRGEVLPLIERARNGVFGESLVVCTTDGIMVDDSSQGENRADLTASLLDKYFDVVLVQTDPVFARLEEFFQPKNAIHTPLYHTGFVIPKALQNPWRGDTILVSAGDGLYGGVLYRAAIDAHRVLWPLAARPMKIVAGTRYPDDEWLELKACADQVDGLEVTRSVADLRREMAGARCSISQCGYNTALSAIGSQTPSLFIPCQDSQRQEQLVRAQRLVYWGAGRLLMPHHLNCASLTNEISQLLQFEPRKICFDMNGVASAVNVIERALRIGGLGLASSSTTGLNLKN